MNEQHFIYGYHAVHAVLQMHPKIIVRLWLQSNRKDERIQTIQQLAEQSNLSIQRVSTRELNQVLKNSSSIHQGIIAQCQQLPSYNESDLMHLIKTRGEPLLLLILDGVQDPHNLGACLRTANAMGVNAVIAPKNRAVGLTPTVRKVACGAAEITPFIPVTNLARTLRQLKQENIWTVGLSAEADQTIAQLALKGDIALVMGAEGKGLRRLTHKECDFLAKIDMYGTVSSMNVSVATAMALYEFRR